MSFGRPDHRESFWKPPEQSWQQQQQPPSQQQRIMGQSTPMGWGPSSGGSSSGQKFQPHVVAESVQNQDGSYAVVCGPCGDTFASDDHLYAHMRGVHKLYVCLQCKIGFSSFPNLSYHRNRKHGHNLELQCVYCGKFFGHRQNLHQHMIKVHKNVASPQK